MLQAATVLKAIIRTVPQWYLSPQGNYVHTITAAGTSVQFSSHCQLTPKLTELLAFAQTKATLWVQQFPTIATSTAVGKISEDLALAWLDLHDATVRWNKWIAYVEELRLMTHENRSVGMNLIISDGTGTIDLTDDRLQKVFATLAADPQVYIRVDRDLRFIDYDEIRWEQVVDSTEYKYSPEFLRPVLSIMGRKDYCAHLTPRGELIVADLSGMLASFRKGQWYIYDADALRDGIVSIIGDQEVGSNLFEILFDLSYRRHGALLIFDPRHDVILRVVNKASLIGSADSGSDLPRRLLAPRINSIHMADRVHRSRKKRLFVAVAELDGAIVFDTDQVLAFGAMIEPHPGVGSHFGARLTAAESALLWGGYAFMISSDGGISIFFSHETSGEHRLDFM